MDFAPTETEQEITRLAARVLQAARPVNVGALVPAAGGRPRRGRSAGPGETYDRALWKELSQAGLLSLALPGWLDGDGLGVAAAAVLLTEIGRRGAAVPALATVMTGVLPVIRWGDPGLQQTLLAGVGTGDTVLTAALARAVRSDASPGPLPPPPWWAVPAVPVPSPDSRWACRTARRPAGCWSRPASPGAAAR